MKNPCDWTVDDLKIISAGSYGLDDIDECVFVKVNENGVIYFAITYENIDTGESEDGWLFVRLNNKGQWTLEY